MEKEEYDNMGREEYRRREEIEKQYSKSFRKFLLTAALSGAILSGGVGVGEFLSYKNQYKDAGRKYGEISRTLNALEEHRKNSDISSKLIYLPEHIRPYIERVTDNERRESLDKAIELVGKDKGDVENTPEFKRYNRIEQSARVLRISATSVACLILLFGASIYLKKEREYLGR